MADIDVSDLLLDPDFTDPLTLIHRTSTVSSLGKNTLVETRVDTYGSVQPISGKDMVRVPEALKMSDIRTFFIKAEILSDGASQYPDIIEFFSQRYQIISVEPWLNFGEGWNKGLCVREKIS